jgi:hypothetical protein
MVVILRQDMLLRHGKLEFISAAASLLVSDARKYNVSTYFGRFKNVLLWECLIE